MTPWSYGRVFVAAVGVSIAFAPPAFSRPVRLGVLLDSSRSMKVSDPQRLAILTVQLLGDLLQPGVDEVNVIPFEPTWQEPCGAVDRKLVATASPASHVLSLKQPGDAAAFRQRLQQIGYDGACTYFAPGIARLLDQFPSQTQGRADETRLLLIVTDGASDAPALDAAAIEPLVTAAAQKGVRVWWVLLGASAGSLDLTRAFANVGMGSHTQVSSATSLVGELTRILTREAGWTEPVTIGLGAGQSRLQLPPNLPLAQIVMLGPLNMVDTDVELLQPSPVGGRRPWAPLGGPGDLVSAAVPALPGAGPGTGYLRMRLRNPVVGDWMIRRRSATGPIDGLLILHPDIDANLRAQEGPHVHAVRVPAGEAVCLEAEVFSVGPSGRVAMQGSSIPFVPEVVLIDDVLGHEQARQVMTNHGTSGDKVAGDETWTACLTPGQPMAGRRFRSSVFINYFQPVNTARQAALNRLGPAVEVLPRLKLVFSPARLVPGRPIDETAPACHDVEIAAGTSVLPSAATRFRVQVWNGTAVPVSLNNKPLSEAPIPAPLENASITWDGQPLAMPGRPAVEQTLGAADIGRKFRFCVTPGSRYSGGPIGLSVAAVPVDADYQRFWKGDSVFTWEADVLAPPFPWRSVLILLGTLLLAAAAVVGTRLVRPLPDDLVLSLYAARPTAGSQAVADLAIAANLDLFDRVRGSVRRTIRDDGLARFGSRGDHTLGRLRTGGRHLFEFAPLAPLERLEPFSDTVATRHSAGQWMSPEVNVPYRLRLTAGDRYLLFRYGGAIPSSPS